MNWFTLTGLLCTLGLSTGCQNPIRDPIDSVVDQVTTDRQEITKGRRQYPFALAQSGGELVTLVSTTDYLNGLIQRLAPSKTTAFPWEIRLVNDSSINAWALPGGKMGVNWGLLDAVESESELVSVLGHEMAHSLERHGTGQQTMGSLVGLASTLIEIGLGDRAQTQTGQQLLSLGQGVIMGQYSQSNELEADREGVRLMVAAGFDPRGAMQMQEKLARLGSGGNSIAQKILGTHPVSRERLAAIQSVVAGYPASDQPESRDFQRMKAELSATRSALDLVTKARQDGGKKAWESALSHLAKAHAQRPGEPSFWRLQAELLVAAGRSGDAVEAALQVVNLAPDDPISEMLLGYCYDAAGDQANAQIARDRAKRLAQ